MIKLNVKMLRASDYFSLLGHVQLKDNTVVMVEHDLLNFNILNTKVEDDNFKFKISTSNMIGDFKDTKYYNLNELMQRFISIDFGILDIKGVESKEGNDSFVSTRIDSKLNNRICSVTYPKGFVDKITKAGVNDFKHSFLEAIGRAISQKYASYDNSGNEEIRQFNKESLLASLYTKMISFTDKVNGNNNDLDNIFHLLIDPLIDHPHMVNEDEKKYVNSILDIIYNVGKESPSYSIMKLQNLLYRFSTSCNAIILPIILVVNALELFINESQAHEYNKFNDKYVPFVYTINNYIKGLVINSISPYKFGYSENMFHRFNENNMIGGQSIGNYTSTIVNNTRTESPIVMDNNTGDMKIVTDDNLKTFLYKDIALSLAGVKNRIEDMETEEDRQKLLKEVEELSNKILDARVRLTDSKSSLVEFDGLDDEIKDTKFDISNFNIFAPEHVATQESFGIVPVNDYFSFGEINPYNINNPTNIKDPLKKVAKRAYVHTENIIVTAVKFIFGTLRRSVDQVGADLFFASKKVANMFSGIFGKINLILGAAYPVTPYGARTHADNFRAIRNTLDTKEKRNKRYKDWQEAKLKAKEKIMSTFTDLSYNEDFPVPLEEEYKFVEVPIEINMESHGEADLIKDIMSKKVKMSFGIKRLLLSKVIGAVNKKLKGKKVDKAMKDRLELENTRNKELMQKALKDNKISKKDYVWFTANCLYDTKSIKVVEPKN